jgi:hypothetical protein
MICVSTLLLEDSSALIARIFWHFILGVQKKIWLQILPKFGKKAQGLGISG